MIDPFDTDEIRAARLDDLSRRAAAIAAEITELEARLEAQALAIAELRGGQQIIETLLAVRRAG